jgi:hypothetical protein
LRRTWLSCCRLLNVRQPHQRQPTRSSANPDGTAATGTADTASNTHPMNRARWAVQEQRISTTGQTGPAGNNRSHEVHTKLRSYNHVQPLMSQCQLVTASPSAGRPCCAPIQSTGRARATRRSPQPTGVIARPHRLCGMLPRRYTNTLKRLPGDGQVGAATAVQLPWSMDSGCFGDSASQPFADRMLATESIYLERESSV